MRRKRLLAFLLCMVLMTGLMSACGKKKETVENQPAGYQQGEIVEGAKAPTVTPLPIQSKRKLITTNYSADFAMEGIPKALSNLTLTAESSGTEECIAIDSSFTLTVAENTSEEEIQEHLKLMAVEKQEEIPFSVKKLGNTTFSITPKETLESGSLYRFLVGDPTNPYAGFVFQTEQELVVKSMYPADQMIGVPTNTGIEIVLSEATSAGIKLEDYIKIEPKTEGEFKRYPDGKTLAFIPKTEFIENGIVTVTVKEGLPGISGSVLKESSTIRFRTANDTSYQEKDIVIMLNQRDYTVPIGDAAELSYYGSYNREKKLSMKEAVVEIYAYGSTMECMDAMMEFQKKRADYAYSTEEYQYPTEGLTKLDTYQAPVELPDEYYNNSTMTLPVLPEGSYLLNITFSGDVSGKEFTEVRQAMLQVTDLLLYTESAYKEQLYWLNDVHTGAIAGASLTEYRFAYSEEWNLFSKEDVGEENQTEFEVERLTTDKNGVAYSKPGERDAQFVLISDGKREAYALVQTNNVIDTSGYYNYLYTDRETYFSNDTVKFFGIIAPKVAGEDLPKSLFLTTSDSYSEVTIPVDENGCFEGSISIDDNARGYLWFDLMDEDGYYVSSKWINITQEDKPVYSVSVSFDQLFYKQGETITATVQTNFYDGTPAPGVEFDLCYYLGDAFYSKHVVSEADGSTKLSWTPTLREINCSYSTNPISVTLEACLIGNELGNQWHYAGAPYFCSNRIFEVNRVVPEVGESYTEVKLFDRDFTKLLTTADIEYPEFPDNSYGKQANGTVRVTLEKKEYIRKYQWTDYDPITKVSTPIYDYSVQTSVVSSEDKTITNGVLRLPHVKPDKGFKGYYQYRICYTDPDTGIIYETECYALEGRNWFYSDYEEPGYVLSISEGPFSLQEKIDCNLTLDSEVITTIPVLYTLYTGEKVQYFYAADGNYHFTFQEIMAPSSILCATAVVDGRLWYLSEESLRYDFEANNNLNVSVQTDKESYRPGETVVVSVQLTDQLKKNLEGCPVAISVVDEACFDLEEQTININNYLAYEYYYVWRDTQFSAFLSTSGYRFFDKSDQGAKADEESYDQVGSTADSVTNGGGTRERVQIRKNFLNNPLFTVTKTNQDGVAVVSFVVPDNITEWRISAIACDPCNTGGAASITRTRLGSKTSDVIATLPFFINLQRNELFLEGDELVASVRAYGSALEAGTKVEYKAQLFENDTLVSTITLESVAGQTAWVNFGKWDCGDYSVLVTANVKIPEQELQDAVELSFRVVESGTLLTVNKETTPEGLSALAPSLYPVRLSFYDTTYQPYVEAANKLLRSYTNRNDSKAAYAIAAASLEKLFENEGSRSDEISEIRKTLSNGYGLISQSEYGEGDLLFSAKLCALAPELLNEGKKTELISCFNNVYNTGYVTDSEELTAALLGMAALGQPVLTDLKLAAMQRKSFTPLAKLTLTAAYAYLGDFSTATALYEELAAEYRTEKNGEIYFAGADTEESIFLTAQALLTAALVRKTDAEGMHRYLSEHESTLSLYQLEQAAYLKYFYPISAKAASFTIEVNGQSETIALKPGEIHNLKLNKKEFENLRITAADKNLGVFASYLGSVKEALAGGQSSDGLAISKEIQVYDQEKDIYKVTLHYEVTTDRNYSCFTINDYIPNGARWYRSSDSSVEQNANGWSSHVYITQNSGQNVSGAVYVYRQNENKLLGLTKTTLSGSVSYFIRGAAEGEFVLDYAVIRNCATEEYAISKSGTLEITDGAWTVNLQ